MAESSADSSPNLRHIWERGVRSCYTVRDLGATAQWDLSVRPMSCVSFIGWMDGWVPDVRGPISDERRTLRCIFLSRATKEVSVTRLALVTNSEVHNSLQVAVKLTPVTRGSQEAGFTEPCREKFALQSM